LSNESKQLSKHKVKIGGMQCSFCTQSIKAVCSRLDGVKKVNVNISHEEALIEYDPQNVKPWQIEESIKSLGYKIRDPNKLRSFEEQDAELRTERNRLVIGGIMSLAAVLFMVAMWLDLMQPWFKFAMLGLASAIMFIVGLYILKMAFHSLRRMILNQHVLMEFAAFGGLAGGLIGFFVPEFPIVDFFAVSVLVTNYHILSGYVSLRVRTKTSQAVRKLLELQPPTARVIRDGEEIVVKIEEVSKGDLVRIRPGEKIPIDGKIVDGSSTIDQSLVTGESIPVERKIGDEVIGGSVNITGALKVEVTRIGEESFLQQVAKYIEEARALKPGILQLVEKVLVYFVPGVLIAALVGFLLWSVGPLILFGEADINRAVFATLAVLVMGYPCALGMATPLAMIRGGGMAAEKGILMRSSEAFHAIKSIDKIIFDKTGTITAGKPRVVSIEPQGQTLEHVLSIAASVESVSEHPLARAVVEKAKKEGIKTTEPQDFENIAGKGVRALINGKRAIVGSPKLLEAEGIAIGSLKEKIKEMQTKGHTVIGVSHEENIIGLLAIADEIKEDAEETIAQLRSIGIESVMITGDNEKAAKSVARKVGIEEVIANVLPNEKADQVRKLQEQGFKVAMVGDGINDAPALMQADVGIAIGAGTDIAIESSDIIIIGDRLSAVLDAYQIGKNSYRKTKHNLILAFAFNGVGIVLATTGLIHPVWAMAAMISSVSTVLANSFGGKMIKKKIIKKNKKKPNKVTLRIPTMHCAGCLTSLLEAVGDVEAVQSVQGDEGKKVLEVSYAGGKSVEEQIRKSITEHGHISS